MKIEVSENTCGLRISLAFEVSSQADLHPASASPASSEMLQGQDSRFHRLFLQEGAGLLSRLQSARNEAQLIHLRIASEEILNEMDATPKTLG